MMYCLASQSYCINRQKDTIQRQAFQLTERFKQGNSSQNSSRPIVDATGVQSWESAPLQPVDSLKRLAEEKIQRWLLIVFRAVLQLIRADLFAISGASLGNHFNVTKGPSKHCHCCMELLSGITSVDKIPFGQPNKDLQQWKKDWCNVGQHPCRCKGARDAEMIMLCDDCHTSRLWDHTKNEPDPQCHPALIFVNDRAPYIMERESNRQHWHMCQRSMWTFKLFR